MINNKAKELITIAISKLKELKELNLIQSTINEAIEHINMATKLIKQDNKDEYKKWLYNAIYDSNYLENSYVNCLTGAISSQNVYKCTNYIEIPNNIKEIYLVMPLCGNIGYHAGAFYDEN